MKSHLFQLTVAAAAAAGSSAADTPVRDLFVCDIPTNGCTNGMFNVEKCECECIAPYCHDWFGDCTNPSNACGGNPWEECVRGESCPWWPNPLKDEACTTGPKVPLDMWEIYNTRSACCNSKFPYSEICDAAVGNGAPTKHPTIDAPEEDAYEVVPIKFDVMGLPDDISMRELKDEMTIVLKRILLRLADRIEGLRITEVEERVVVTRNLGKRRKEVRRRHRDLKQDVTLYFNVYVVRDESKKFGPLIIREIRDSYGEVMEQVQQFADTKYFGGDLNLNWCTSQNGEYEDCVQDVLSPPTPVRAPTPVVIQSDPDDGGGLDGWVIAIIIIFVLLFVCCVGYAIAVMCFGVAGCFGGHHDTKEVHNNIYNMDDGYIGNMADKYVDDNFMDDDKYGDAGHGRSHRNRAKDGRSRDKHTSRRSERAGRSGGRSRRSHSEEEYEDEVQIVLAEPQDPKFEDDSFTVNTYETSTKQKRKQGRDPTMYIPGQEDKPDPDSDVLMIADGSSTSNRSRRYYSEDPPLKPKRDPTMYAEGGQRNYASEDPPLKPKRDPTMFVEGQLDPSMYVEGQEDPSVYVEGQEDPSVYVKGRQDPSMYVDGASVDAYSIGLSRSSRRSPSVEGLRSVDPYGLGGMGGIDDSDYDQFGYMRSELEAESMMSAEHVRGRRDPSDYVEDESFRTHDPSVAQSSRKKKKSKKKKSSRS